MGIHSPIETNGAETHSAKPGQLQRATFSTSRLLDFCSEKELTNLTGHPPPEWPLVVVKELVDNAIDACEGAGIAPVVSVTVDAEGIGVFDNGPGIPAETIKGVLDYNMPVSSREAYVSLTRGAQGNALQTILAMPFVLCPRPGPLRGDGIAAHNRLQCRPSAAKARHRVPYGAHR
jgi:hypothetical protein